MPKVEVNKDERKAKKKQLKNWKAFLLSSEIIEKLEALTFADLTDFSENLLDVLRPAGEIWNIESMNLDKFYQLFNDSQVVQAKNTKILIANEHFKILFRRYKSENASHWEKRLVIRQLGLKRDSFSIVELLKAGKKSFNGIRFVERNRDLKHGVKHFQFLSENKTIKSKTVIVNEETGYNVVNENDSVIFYSFLDPAREQIRIEFVVIRGVGCNSPFSSLLYSWLAGVAKEACNSRRNVRPNHPGQLVQVGLNMGPRHARVLGWAKSYTKVLDSQAMIEGDCDAVGGLSIMWSLAQSVMPHEVQDHVNSQLAAVGLPRLATRNVDEGCGFHIKIRETTFLFPTAERAPPEGYFGHGYEAWTHTDPAFCKYAFSLCTSRQTPESGTQSIPGSSFVDIGLKVVIRQATGTMMAFQPEQLHGTTNANGAVNTGMAITFSRRVCNAWEDARRLEGKVQVEVLNVNED